MFKTAHPVTRTTSVICPIGGSPAKDLTGYSRHLRHDPTLSVAWFFAGKCQFQLGHYANAIRSLQRPESSGYSTIATAEISGDANCSLGNYGPACTCYRLALRRSSASATLLSKLGLAEAKSGNASAGVRRLRDAIKRDPSNAESHDRLITVEEWLNRFPEAAKAAEEKLTAVPSQPEDYLRAARMRVRMAEWRHAEEILHDGLEIFPDSEPLRVNLSKLEETLALLRGWQTE